MLNAYREWKFKRKSKIKLNILLERLNFETNKVLQSEVPKEINEALEKYRDSRGFEQKNELYHVRGLENNYIESLLYHYNQFMKREIDSIINERYQPNNETNTLTIKDNYILEQTKKNLVMRVYAFKNNVQERFEEQINQVEREHKERIRKEYEIAENNYRLYQQLINRISRILGRKGEQVQIVTKEFVEREELMIDEDIKILLECEAQKKELERNNTLRQDHIDHLDSFLRRVIQDRISKKEQLRVRLNLKVAIENGDAKRIKELVPQKNNLLKPIEHPPKFLIHGISPIRADESGSWEYVAFDFNNEHNAGLTAKEYVDLLLKILKDGIKPSNRIHFEYSSPEHPAIYFYDAEDSQVGINSYGIIELIVDTSKIKLPIIQAPGTGRGATEYLIYTKNLQMDFGIRLTCCYRPAVYRQFDSLPYFHLQVEEEMKKINIPFTETPLFVKNKRSHVEVFKEYNISHSSLYERPRF